MIHSIVQVLVRLFNVAVGQSTKFFLSRKDFFTCRQYDIRHTDIVFRVLHPGACNPVLLRGYYWEN